MGHAMTKNERLEQMKWLYFQRAYSDEEMAQVLQVNRTTVYRDRLELETEYMMIEVQPGRFKLDPRQNLATLKPTLEEALALYLAGRRFSQRTQIAFQHTASGLAKLALAMRNPMAEKLVKSASELLARGEDADRGRILSTLAEAWVQRLKLRLHYQGLGGTRMREYIVSPYLIEPSPWGDGIYLIGPAEPQKKIATFKVERIQAAYIMTEEFQIPDNFDERDLLQHAWGIWHEDRQPITIRLRFASGRAAKRLQESRWHPSEKVTVLADGSCEWEAQVSEWQEMLPWVRGWGADVEVLEPEELRWQIISEAKRLGRLYQVIPENNNPDKKLLQCWGKTGILPSEYHPAIFHMLDVGNIAKTLLSQDASPRWRNILSLALGTDSETLCEWLPYWIALHDIGKISSAFQGKIPEQRDRMIREGFNFGEWSWTEDLPHNFISEIFLANNQDGLSIPPGFRQALQEAAASHHGRFALPQALKDAGLRLRYEHGDWVHLRNTAARKLEEELLVRAPKSWSGPENISIATMVLAGFTILCDWLGSNQKFFQVRQGAYWDDYRVEIF